MASVVCLHFIMQEEDVLENTSVKCHLCHDIIEHSHA